MRETQHGASPASHPPPARRPSDIQDALEFYAFLAHTEPDGTERMTMVVVPGTPPSKARVRFGKGNVYNSAQVVAAEKRTATYVQAAIKGRPYEGNVALGCIFYRPNHQRVDADNMLKHVCDAINGLAFKDDSQVTAIAARVELDKENPRTVIVLGPHQSTLTRGINDSTPCAGCGEPIPLAKYLRSHGNTRFCSVDCRRKSRAVDLSEPVPCIQCGEPFVRVSSYRKLCSKKCQVLRQRSGRKPKFRSLSDCTDCGKQLTHNRGGRCRDCWRANPKGVAA